MTDEPDKTGRVRQPVTAALLGALLFLSASAQQQIITGKVVGVSDGDTITVLDASNRQRKIRLKTEAEAQAAGYRKARNCPQ